MIYNPDGTVMFRDIYELYYDTFMEIGLGIGQDQYLYDQDTCTHIKFKDKFIKATIDRNCPIYAGRNDIIFEPDKNFGLMQTLFHYYLDKCQNSDDGDTLGGYIADYIDDNITKDKQAVALKTIQRGEIKSNYYSNAFLGFFDCIFRIAGYNPNLDNIDAYFAQLLLEK